MAKINYDSDKAFYMPDSFDRSVMTYCTSSPTISNMAVCKSDTCDSYTYAVNSLGSLSSGGVTISGAVDTVKDSFSELEDRICALEAAMAKPVQHKPPVSAQRWRYDRRSFKTLGTDLRTPSLSRLFAAN